MSQKEIVGEKSQDSDMTLKETNENEVKTAHPQLTKRKRKKPAPRNQDFLCTI
jgi:hypothetical protein